MKNEERAATRLVGPDDVALRGVFGLGDPSLRAYRARLRRAEKRGLLPQRVYLSCQRFAYRSDELRAALDALPTSHTATLRERDR